MKMARLDLALVLVLVGCFRWRPAEVPSPGQPLAGNPHYARVFLTDSSVVELKNPSNTGDTIFGTTDIRPGDLPTPIKIPLTQVKRIDVLRLSAFRTVGLTVLSIVVVFGGSYMWIAMHPYT